MTDTHETTADVIAAMRDEAARADMEQDYSINDAAEMMREFAWRFEAAHKREVRGAVTDCNQCGDAAKLREALRKINNLCGIGVVEISSFEIGSICDAALSSPPRNCDRPECATTKAAQEVWRREDGGKTAYYEWLLATANAAVSIIGRESLSKQCWECANCNRPTAGWDGSKFRCAFLAKDFGTWHYDVPNECPCKGKGWIPKKKEGCAK